MVGRRWHSYVAAVVGAVLVAGCASARHGAAGSGGATGPAAITAQPMMVTKVERVDARHVRVTAQVPAPTATCVRDLTGRVTDTDARSVFVQLTYTTPPPAAGTCTGLSSASTVVTVPVLGNRQLVADLETPWAPVAGSTAFRHCTGPFGCAAPPRDHCDPGWLSLAGHAGELPPERSYKNVGCDRRWLVMDVSATVTGCQLNDGPRPAGCRATTVRWFYEFEPDRGWVVVASGRAAGCASVHRTVSSFPTTLCGRLPAG